MQTWYHIARTPGGLYVHRLDPIRLDELAVAEMTDDPELSRADADADVLGDAAEAIRRGLGFPARARWASREGWDSQVTAGEPHPKLMEQRVNEDIDQLPDGVVL